MATTFPAGGKILARHPHKDLRGLWRSLLGLRLFYKVLLANTAIVLGVTVVVCGILAASRVVSLTGALEVGALILSAALLPAVLLNALTLRLALQPLERLQSGVAAVRHGDAGARAQFSHFADPEQRELVSAFNAMLEASARDRARLQELAASALAAAEHERERIALELHDQVAQSLAAVLLQLRFARNACGDAREAELDKVARQIADTSDEVGRIAWALKPPALDMLGLGRALESHARTIASRAGLELILRISYTEGRLAPAAALALYRVAQEALYNVQCHAHAHSVAVELHESTGMVRVVITDDGRGFAHDRALSAAGAYMGLFGMQERVSCLGGTLHVETRQGGGTRIIAEVPIREIQHV